MIKLNLQKQLDAESGKMKLDVDMTISKGSFVAIFGDSGAGKTSILRMLSGLINADSGRIEVENEIWFDGKSKINLKPQQRNIGFLFQDYALFPNMTVRENLVYALEKGQNPQIIDDLISTIELKDLQNKMPANLSGGQKQRVALARTLVRKPKILLLDEPLSALDAKMRTRLQDYILKVHRQFKLTTILVSHNTSEVVKMADEVFILDQGEIKQKGSPAEVFTSKKMSGKFQFAGEVIQIKKEGIINILTVLIGINFVKIIADDSDIEDIKVGDNVMVASKAFNPVIQKII